MLQAMILTDGAKMLLAPTYHAFHLYRPFQGARQVRAELRDVPDDRVGARRIAKVSATAAIGKDGKLYPGPGQHAPQRARVRTGGRRRSPGEGQRAPAHRQLPGCPQDVRGARAPAAHAGKFTGKGGQLQIDLPPSSVMVLAIE